MVPGRAPDTIPSCSLFCSTRPGLYCLPSLICCGSWMGQRICSPTSPARYFGLLLPRLYGFVITFVFSVVESSILTQGVSAGVFHNTRTGGNCPTSPTISRLADFALTKQGYFRMLNFLRCRQSLTVEALAWAEFALSGVALFWTCVWVGFSGRRRVRESVRDSRRMV